MPFSVIPPISGGVPIKHWLPVEQIEPGALEQAINLSRLPFAHRHIALMPDVHQGYGMPIGAVFASKTHISPPMVGVDIGCGMLAVKTDVKAGFLRATHEGEGTNIRALVSAIKRNIPTGNGSKSTHPTPQIWISDDETLRLQDKAYLAFTGAPPSALLRALERASYQLGTLGGGNHFIEVDEDENGDVWLMLHSGSRALGKMTCDYFEHVAQAANQDNFSSIPKQWKLSFMPIHSDSGEAYLAWMNLCVRFAEANRRKMMYSALGCLDDIAGVTETHWIETCHNFARYEHHMGDDVMVTRKGACSAQEGFPLIIPGSMETGSYICAGLGVKESFMSCSHGAGRKMSRRAARESRSVQDMVESLKRKNIALATNSVQDVVDEAGHAYKDIAEVMAHQSDLVEVKHSLTPIGVVKGSGESE